MTLDLFESNNSQEAPQQNLDLFAQKQPQVQQQQPSIQEQDALPQQGDANTQEKEEYVHEGPSMTDNIIAYSLGLPQGVAEHVSAIAQLGDDGINKLFGTNLQSPHPNVFIGKTRPLAKLPAARYGKMSGAVLTDLLLGGSTARLVEAAPLLTRLATYGASGAATTPGGMRDRITTGLLSAGFGGTGDYLFSVLKHLPSYMRDTSLAKLVFKVSRKQKKIAKKLYNSAFKKIGKRLGFVNEEAQTAISDLRAIKKGNAKIEMAITTYNKNPTIEGLHGLRSDIGKEQAYLRTRSSLGKLSSTERDRLVHINKFKTGLDNSLEQQIKSLDPSAYEGYLKAQKHWRTNVLPFEGFNSVRKLVKNGEITGTLRNNLAKKYISDKLFPHDVMQHAKRIRQLTGLLADPLKSVHTLKRTVGKVATYGTLAYLLGRKFEHNEDK